MAIPHPATRVHLLALTALCPALVSGEGDTGAAQKGNSYTLKVHKCAKVSEALGCTRREASGKRRLACPWLPNEQNNSVEWEVRSMYSGTEGEIQDCL